MHHKLVIIEEPTDIIKNLSEYILSYLYKIINDGYNLDGADPKILDMKHDTINSKLDIFFNIKYTDPKGMLIMYSIPYKEYNIILRKEKILKLKKLSNYCNSTN